ncbi:alcohol dehydrogenase-like regulatory protein ErcA [Neptunomonas phycophila]|jgi:alcohol dehydrogenase class IV|uniref:Alcohol dehydrogenase-like regulatory protein ErcA n=1 Tax=Neptunomonas phycophila TaxID=1572645 RepID=A0AAW7XGQ9_9GAMM|nr:MULTISPECIES: alcohol dehydrogenase-like regulatory protein ErcA [Neptunomonas]MBT3145260.1 iron-containing alcohol dehydrogenase [Neptunomonas phycophila]MDN2659193.1 iron-containing alcohol dehydrogenase [Neptunomonas sp. CHC150]MDO6453508.1 alcohol dehydrogenase-like regulatory protein ErcA [Neptunomonas phycophila]MDO6468340.1 alcohol dehydrogenase-like regulatory protein ErcA [Neptunomonas phycophila]MDO6784787.1 alcohol dehydrogenase-like regulatory protein ErcA [Neptunomonas phycophi
MASDISNLRKFVSPEIIFGAGARHTVANYASTFGARKVLIVSDPGVVAAGWVADVIASLEAQDIDYAVFTNVSPNPRCEEVMAGAEFYIEQGCNVIVGVGGGSPMDCAKGIGIVSTHGRHILEFVGVDMIDRPIPPLIFVPTTAGTSADVSQFAIISDQAEMIKVSIVSKSVVPDVSLIDPETTVTVDPFLSACTGVDALVHAIEAFVSTGAGPLTDMHALDAIRIINTHLVDLVNNPKDIFLREQIMLGSMKAGLAFSNAILGAVHAMSHSLGGFLDLPHGLCNAMLLEHVINFNYPEAENRFKVIAQTLGIDVRGLTTLQVKQRLIQHLVALKANVGLTQKLGINGVTPSDIPILSAKAMTDPCILTNPRRSNQRDVEVVYEEAL